jgi:hypothetical protein
MKTFKSTGFMLFFIGTLFFLNQTMAQSEPFAEAKSSEKIPAKEKLVVLWTSGDREVALKMVFMYTFNAKKRAWFDDITLVVWGPSAKLLTEDQELQDYLKQILDAGVTVKACKGCSDQYGVSEQLEDLGINVLYIGKELSDYLKEDRKMLTI